MATTDFIWICTRGALNSRPEPCSSCFSFFLPRSCCILRHDEGHRNLQGTSNVLLVDGPDPLQVDWLLPGVQHCHDLPNPSQIRLEDFFQIVTAGGGAFDDDAELVVHAETHIEEDVLRVSQAAPLHLYEGSFSSRNFTNTR